MRKLISSINVTIDGYCDHTHVIADDDLHDYAAKLLDSSGVVVLGSATFRLFESAWPEIAKNSEGTESEVRFAKKLDAIQKTVFSHTIESSDWQNASVKSGDLAEEIMKLKNEPGKDLLTFGSPGLLISLSNLRLVDEYQFVVQPMLVGRGRLLTQGLESEFNLEHIGTERFGSGAVVHTYRPFKD